MTSTIVRFCRAILQLPECVNRLQKSEAVFLKTILRLFLRPATCHQHFSPFFLAPIIIDNLTLEFFFVSYHLKTESFSDGGGEGGGEKKLKAVFHFQCKSERP